VVGLMIGDVAFEQVELGIKGVGKVELLDQ
jgi:hypothetical protein